MVAVVGDIERLVAGRELLDPIALGVNLLLVSLHKTPLLIAPVELDAHGSFGVGEDDRFGVGALHGEGLGRILPLVKECAVTARIDFAFGGHIHDAEKLVAEIRRIQQRPFRATPIGFGLQAVEEIVFGGMVARVLVVETHRAVEEIGLKLHLRRSRIGPQNKEQGQ